MADLHSECRNFQWGVSCDFELVDVVALRSIRPVVDDVPLVERGPDRGRLACLGGEALGLFRDGAVREARRGRKRSR